jgi:hypothetical protein
MNTEKINLENIGSSRKAIKTGDVFIFKPKERLFYYGVVVNSDASIFTAKGLIHIHLFNINSEKGDSIPNNLYHSELLVPPILTNKLGWTKGYFKTIENVAIENFPLVKNATFFYYNGKIFNDNSNELPKPKSIEETGSFAVTSYLNIDNLISLSLEIPLAVPLLIIGIHIGTRKK